MFKTLGVLIALCLGMMLSGCFDEPLPTAAPSVDKTDIPLPTIAAFDSAQGVIGPGSLYGVYKPHEWNGDLVLFAHGIVSPLDPTLQLPDVDAAVRAIRDALLNLGYGVAMSSYPENGYCVKEAIIATQQLRGIYISHFGPPRDTYLIGESMGGLVAVSMAEKHPNQYAGALAISGVVGGSQLEFNYVLGLRAIFDYYYPDVLPGTVTHVPSDTDINAAVGAAVGAILSNPLPLFELASVVQLDLRYNDLNELLNTVVTCLYVHLNVANDLVARVGGRDPFDNSQIWYSGTSDDAALNTGVARFHLDPPADNFYAHYYEPDGHLQIPVLTLHNTRDPLVGAGHPERYAQVVAAANCSSMLQQRYVERFGHLAFTTEEIVDAFEALVSWRQSLRSDRPVRGGRNSNS